MRLDELTRALLAVALVVAAVRWALVITGRHRPRRPVDEDKAAAADGPYLFSVALLVLGTGLALYDGGPQYGGVLLSVIALGGWTQERLLRQARPRLDERP